MDKGKDIFRDIYKKIPKNVLLCFSAGMLFGIVAHFYMLANKLPNWDDLNNINGFGSGSEYGRWFLEYIYQLMGKWSVPALNGMLAIIFFAMASCFILSALDLKSCTSAVLVPLMMLTFPSIASMMTFMFTVHLYAIAVLMCCMGAYFFRRYRWGLIPAIVLFVLSCGIYQSFICLAAGILVFGFILDLLRDSSFKDVVRNGIKALITLAVSLILYLGVSKAFTSYLTDNRGISTMGHIDILRLPRLVMRSYKRILEYFVIKPFSFTSQATQVFHIMVCILIVVLLVWIVKEKKLYKDLPKTILLGILTLVLPLALASIYILAPETDDATLLMLFQYSFVFVVLIGLSERCLELSGSVNHTGIRAIIGRIAAIAAILMLLLVGYQQYRVTNEAYFRTKIAFDRVYAYYNRIMIRIEDEPEYQYGDAIAVLGDFYPDPTPISSNIMDDDKYADLSGVAMEGGLMTSGVRSNFLRIYLGIHVPELEHERTEAIMATKEYQSMPVYPDEASIRRIDDVWVVKLHENEDK